MGSLTITLAPILLTSFLIIPPGAPRTATQLDLSPDMAMPEAEPVAGWMTSFDEAQAVATERQLPLVLHFEAVWCGACRTMDSQVMEQDAVHDVLGSAVIGVRIDADERRDLISRFAIASLPTEVVLAPDGSEIARYVGGVSLSQYVARLGKLSTAVASDSESHGDSVADGDSVAESGDQPLRSCLIVRRDGRMVGLGGFSPVALTAARDWQRGTEEFAVTYEGVDYFLQSADEVARFTEAPEAHIPRLHGCDLVALSREGRAEPGAIEFGSFYKGDVYFFASMSNRNRFQSNPEWYVKAMSQRRIDNREEFPFFEPQKFE